MCRYWLLVLAIFFFFLPTICGSPQTQENQIQQGGLAGVAYLVILYGTLLYGSYDQVLVPFTAHTLCQLQSVHDGVHDSSSVDHLGTML